MTAGELLQWQLEHYALRLAEAKTTEERAWIRNELYHLKNRTNGSDIITNNSLRFMVHRSPLG